MTVALRTGTPVYMDWGPRAFGHLAVGTSLMSALNARGTLATAGRYKGRYK
jgi:hypothetical protein